MRKLGLAALVAGLLCGNLVRIPTSLVQFKNVAVLPVEAAIGIIAILCIIANLRRRRLFVHNAVLTAPILLFALAAVVSLGVNIRYYNLSRHEVVVAGAYLVRWLFYSLIYLIAIDCVRTRREFTLAVKLLIGGITIFALFGIFQAILLPNFAFIVYPDARAAYNWDIQRARLVSTFLDPNFAGCLVGMGLAGSIAFLQEGYRKAWWLGGLFGVALLLTYSRGSALGFLVGFLYLVAAGKAKKRAILAALLVCLIGLAAAPYLLSHAEAYNRLTIHDLSAQGRVDAWYLCLDLIRENPVFGLGFNTTPFIVPRYGFYWGAGYGITGAGAFEVTGGILTIYLLTGIFGTVAYCYIFIRAWLMARFISLNSKDKLFRALAKSSTVSIIILFVTSFFTMTILYVFLMGLTWILFGLVNVAYTSEKALKIRTDAQTARRGSPVLQTRAYSDGPAVTATFFTRPGGTKLR